MMRECWPEEHRLQRFIKGADSEPMEGRIPEGMTEREARDAGYI
jgi:hypothetical protein